MREEEQIKEFWEWCGLHYTEPYWIDDDNNMAFYGASKSELLRSVCLNNLFGYAVPKLRDRYEVARVLSDWLNRMQDDYSNAGSHLLRAIQEVIHAKS